MLTAEQIVAAQRANVETLFGLTNKAFEGVEKLVELNLQVAKAAMGEAARMAGLEAGHYRTVGFPEQKDFFQELRASLGAHMKTWVARETFGADAEMLQRFEQVKRVRGMSGLQARMPFALEVH